MKTCRCATLAAGLALLGTLVVAADRAQAQIRPQAGRKIAPNAEVKLPELTTSGTVEGLLSGGIRIKSDAGQTWLLQMQPTTKMLLTGTAKVDFLSPGYCISFTADVDARRSKVESKVGKLMIFTPSATREVGAVPNQGFGAAGGGAAGGGAKAAFGDAKPAAGGAKPAGGGAAASRGEFKPGADGGTFGADFGAGKSGGSRKGGRAAGGEKIAGPNVRSFDVSGQITAIKNGKVTLHVPNGYFKSTLKLELTADPEITVEMMDPRSIMLVRPGDKVKVVGSQVGESVGRIHDIQVVLSVPLSGQTSKKKPPAKTDRMTPTRKPDDVNPPHAAKDRPSGGDESEAKPVRKAKPSPRPKPAPKDLPDDASGDAPGDAPGP